MQVKIYPSKIGGKVMVPASKSMAHRALICASLAKDESLISGLSWSKDIEATIACMQALGARIQQKEEGTWSVRGCDPCTLDHDVSLHANESGSTLRFIIPIAALGKQKTTFSGQGRLMERPMKVYQDLFDQEGLLFEQKDGKIMVQGPLKANTFQVSGNVSSQFISGLLMALPLLKEDSMIEILPPYQSKSYVDLTLKSLSEAGIQIKKEKNVYGVLGNQKYNAKHYVVEKDYSQAAFFAVLAALNDPLSLTGMDLSSRQGDKAILEHIKNLGAEVIEKENEILIRPNKRCGQTIDLANCPDLGPILCVMAAFVPGKTKIIHAARLRMKESDRIAAMEEELRKWGVNISSNEDSITIYGKERYTCDHEVAMNGHNDHRIVMACTIFGLCADSNCRILGAEAIEKSYPDFFKDIQKIGGKVEII